MPAETSRRQRGRPMGSDTRTGDRLDAVSILLQRASSGDQRAAAALVDVLGPRIHGLAVHVTGSSARAGSLTVRVLRSCLHDARALAAGDLPGDVAVLDRARRAAVATQPRGAVRSLIAPEAAHDRTQDRREVDVMRTLLELPPAQRALVESAAQGRFAYSAAKRPEAATVLAQTLDQLVPLGGPHAPEIRALAALDALALAQEDEQRRLHALTDSPERAGIHRHAVEAAAQLTLLTAQPPSRGLHAEVLDGFPAGPGAEVAYRGTYSTPVLGTDSQRREVGPPALTGGMPSTAPSALPLHTPDTGPAPVIVDQTPAFTFSASDEVRSSRRRRARASQDPRSRGRVPWLSRSVAALALVGAVVLGGFLVDARRELADTRDFASSWALRSVQPDAELVHGRSDNGRWQAVITQDGISLRAEGVLGYQDEVLQLWAETDGVQEDLGVLDLSRDGLIRFTSPETADRLVVTREMAPQNQSGTASSRVVASLDPGASEQHTGN